jgi:acylphosphatase
MRRVRVRITGRVHGVFFRVTCAERARAAGLAGWVRNRSDGTVEAEFEGADEDVAEIVAWCAQGPPGADVERVDREELEPAGEQGFTMRPTT